VENARESMVNTDMTAAIGTNPECQLGSPLVRHWHGRAYAIEPWQQPELEVKEAPTTLATRNS
jgi:hypothetical protein